MNTERITYEHVERVLSNKYIDILEKHLVMMEDYHRVSDAKLHIIKEHTLSGSFKFFFNFLKDPIEVDILDDHAIEYIRAKSFKLYYSTTS